MNLQLIASSGNLIIQIVLYTALYILTMRINGLKPALRLLYMLWVATSLALNLYYLVHVLQNKGLYLPFSAVLVATAGIYILLPSALKYNFDIRLRQGTVAGTIAAVIGALNVGLWALWSGSYLEDVLLLLPFMYFVVIVVRSMEITGIFSLAEWIVYGSGSAMIIVLQVLIYFTEGTIYTVLDTVASVLMFSATLYTLFKAMEKLRRGTGDEALTASAATFLMASMTMYLSYEPLYFIAELVTVIAALFTYFSLRKKGGEAV